MITDVTFNNFKDRSGGLTLSPCTALIGPVGSGKSSIIEIVRLCLGLPTRHGATGLGALSSSGTWEGCVTVRGHRAARCQLKGRTELRFDGSVVKEGDYKVKLAIATGVGAVPDVDLGEFLSKSGQERAALFGRLLANDPVTMEQAVKGATGMGVIAFIKAETGRDVKEAPWAEVKGTPSEIVDMAKGMVNDLKAKARDCEAHLREMLARPPGDHEDLASLQSQLETVNQRLGEIKGLSENMDNAMASKRAAETSLASLDSRVNELRANADSCEAGIAKKLETIEQVKASLEEIQHKLSEAEADSERLNREIADAAALRRDVPPGDPLAGLDMDKLAPVPPAALTSVCYQFNISGQDAEDDRLNELLLALVVKPWIAAQRESCMAATEAHKQEQATLQNHLAALRVSWTTASKAAEGHRKTLNDTKNHLASLTREVEDNRQSVLQGRAAADKAAASRSELVAQAQKAVVFADKEVLEAEKTVKAQDAARLGEAIRGAQKAMQVRGQIDRAQFEHMQAEAVAKAMQALQGKLQAWRDQITKTGMDAVLGPFRAAVSSVMPGADVDIRIAGSGRSTAFDFVLVRDGTAVPLEHLSAGETALVGAAFLSAMHTLMQSKARLLTIDAEALDEPTLARLMAAVPTLGFECCLLASNRLRPDQVPEGWGVLDCANPPVTVGMVEESAA